MSLKSRINESSLPPSTKWTGIRAASFSAELRGGSRPSSHIRSVGNFGSRLSASLPQSRTAQLEKRSLSASGKTRKSLLFPFG